MRIKNEEDRKINILKKEIDSEHEEKFDKISNDGTNTK
jgi:hypothetical protein